MAEPLTFPIRKECPPGACDCDRATLLATAGADTRILLLTSAEEHKLLARIEAIGSLDDLRHVTARLQAQLGVQLRVAPGPNEVRTVRGLLIDVAGQPGLCRKTRKAIPAAVRRCLERQPHIVYALLDAHDLLG